jgi:hypothetical protein
MWIALIGSPTEGHKVCGPFATAKAIDEAPVQQYDEPYCGSGYWSIELQKPSYGPAQEKVEGYDPVGKFIVFTGDITREWADQFFGPFHDFAAAQNFCIYNRTNCILKLMPVPAEEEKEINK